MQERKAAFLEEETSVELYTTRARQGSKVRQSRYNAVSDSDSVPEQWEVSS